MYTSRGLIWWMRSHVRPQLGSTSALKFSTSASQTPMRRSTSFSPSGMLRVEADRELAVVERVEVRRGVELLLSRDLGGGRRLFAERVELRVRVDLFRTRQPGRLRLVADDARRGVVAMVVIATGAFNMDDLGAVMCEKPRRPRADGFPGEVEDADAGEDARAHRSFRVHRDIRVHRTAPDAASAAISLSFIPRSRARTCRVCSPRCGARRLGSIPIASHATGPRG